LAYVPVPIAFFDHIKKGILFSLIQGCGVAYGWSSLGSDSIPAPRPLQAIIITQGKRNFSSGEIPSRLKTISTGTFTTYIQKMYSVLAARRHNNMKN